MPAPASYIKTFAKVCRFSPAEEWIRVEFIQRNALYRHAFYTHCRNFVE